MLGQGEAVGHAGDEIGDVAGKASRAGRRRLVAPFGRQRLGVGAVPPE